jgi:hypothetical protein
MTKLMYIVLGILVLSGTILMASVSPRRDSRDASLDVRALEQSMNLKALPKQDLDPNVYR